VVESRILRHLWRTVSYTQIIKYVYFAAVKNFALSIVNDSYQGEERVYRMKMIRKLTFDFFFYLSTSVSAYYFFGHEYWFPKLLGGSGECSDILKSYPNWPSEATTKSL
jgi:hypothetical protein